VGARAVQVGTATFVRPRAAAEVLDEMVAFLNERGLSRIGDWIGVLTADRAQPAVRRARPSPQKAAR